MSQLSSVKLDPKREKMVKAILLMQTQTLRYQTVSIALLQ